jgi:hypothetical protein
LRGRDGLWQDGGVSVEEVFVRKGVGDGVALKLGVSGLPAEDIMVFASPPYKAGWQYCGDYRFIGLLPVPVKGWSAITALRIPREHQGNTKRIR